MNYRFLIAPVVCLCMMLSFSCGDGDEPTMTKPEIVLDQENLEMKGGESIRLVASFIPEETENKAHTWTSSNPDVATVDETGLVKAIAPGTTKITAKALSGGKTASCNVTVIPTPVEGVSLNKTDLDMLVGSTYTLIASIKPNVATNKNVKWSSANTKVATVGNDGVVKGISLGSTTVTATTEDGEKTAKCTVNVVDKIINAPSSLTSGGGIEFSSSPYGLGYLEALSSSTGRWHTGKEYSWQCTATYTYSRTSKTSATFSSRATQSITGRVWTITATLNFTDSDSGTATYKAVAPTGATESSTTKFKIYTYYPTPQ